MLYQGILLSGLPFSGKSTLKDLVIERTGWGYYGVGDTWKTKFRADNPGRPMSEFPAWWARTTDEENIKVNKWLRTMVEEKLKNGESMVVDTRYPPPLKGLPLLRIFVSADMAIRVTRAVDKKLYPTREEAESTLKRREDDEYKMGMKWFGVDYRDPRLYDLIIDSGKMRPDEELAKVLAALSHK